MNHLGGCNVAGSGWLLCEGPARCHVRGFLADFRYGMTKTRGLLPCQNTYLKAVIIHRCHSTKRCLPLREIETDESAATEGENNKVDRLGESETKNPGNATIVAKKMVGGNVCEPVPELNRRGLQNESEAIPFFFPLSRRFSYPRVLCTFVCSRLDVIRNDDIIRKSKNSRGWEARHMAFVAPSSGFKSNLRLSDFCGEPCGR
ncbi:hypothetical protein BDP67DRAFT_175065 [Colletotrichum lupini]|nr:hypothetical protein BDP67DRAFT_175065 [Colletotrichum lupini]